MEAELSAAEASESHLTAGATPRVGAIAPDFAAPGSTGTLRRLSALTSGRYLILIFYRGYW